MGAVAGSGEARAILREKVPVFRAHPALRIAVTGYASQRGTRSYNEALGLRRGAFTILMAERRISQN